MHEQPRACGRGPHQRQGGQQPAATVLGGAGQVGKTQAQGPGADGEAGGKKVGFEADDGGQQHGHSGAQAIGKVLAEEKILQAALRAGQVHGAQRSGRRCLFLVAGTSYGFA